MVFLYLAMVQTGPLTCQVLSGFSDGTAWAGMGTTTKPSATERAISRRTDATPKRNGPRRALPLLGLGRALVFFRVIEYIGLTSSVGERLRAVSGGVYRRHQW
jgi:hypothetical protein